MKDGTERECRKPSKCWRLEKIKRAKESSDGDRVRKKIKTMRSKERRKEQEKKENEINS